MNADRREYLRYRNWLYEHRQEPRRRRWSPVQQINEPRVCVSCEGPFMPELPWQKRCDNCIRVNVFHDGYACDEVFRVTLDDIRNANAVPMVDVICRQAEIADCRPPRSNGVFNVSGFRRKKKPMWIAIVYKRTIWGVGPTAQAAWDNTHSNWKARYVDNLAVDGAEMPITEAAAREVGWRGHNGNNYETGIRLVKGVYVRGRVGGR